METINGVRSLLRGALALPIALSLAACSHDPGFVPTEDAHVGDVDADATRAPDVPDVSNADIAETDRSDDSTVDTSACGELPEQQSCTFGGVAGCGLVCVPGGTFTLGDDRVPSGSPSQGRVTVGRFLIDRYEVTVARFRRFWVADRPAVNGSQVRYPSGNVSVDADGTEPFWDPRCNWDQHGGVREDHPLNCVTWNQAQAFCVWDANQPPTSERTGRLPTEAEWEFAAQGPSGRLYPWGDSFDPARVCVNRDTGTPRTCAVDDPRFALGEGPFGLRQMAGNVSEWTADAFCRYPTPSEDGGAPTAACARAGQTNPLCARCDVAGDAGSGGERVLRGGDWDENHDDLPTASRVGVARGDHPLGGGFRCVRSVQ